ILNKTSPHYCRAFTFSNINLVHPEPDGLFQPNRQRLVRRDGERLPIMARKVRKKIEKALTDEDLYAGKPGMLPRHIRSEEHTSELRSLMRISYAVLLLK